MHLAWVEYGNLILIVLNIHVAADIYQEKKVETKQDKKGGGEKKNKTNVFREGSKNVVSWREGSMYKYNLVTYF